MASIRDWASEAGDYIYRNLPMRASRMAAVIDLSCRKEIDKAKEKATKRITQALKVAQEYGSVDGEHHKMWVIDQMVRALLTEGAYEDWKKDAEHRDWDEGIAP